MVPHHVVVAAIVLVGLWVLYRWGALIFTIYALAHFWLGQWDRASLALCFAAITAFFRGFDSWVDWHAFGRAAWMHTQSRYL